MQRREGLRIKIQKTKRGWMPQPREAATLTLAGKKYWLIGGMSYDTFADIACG